MESRNKAMEHFKSEKRRTIVGPWKNVAEFEKVYDWLFADTANRVTYERALSEMHVWSLRRSSLCPAAVLATSTLLEVQLMDEKCDSELQALYASAFTRFFNFMSSVMQTHNQRSMYDTAQELGLQSFVVDLRHICAHGQALPPLEVLRSTATYCLNWLKDYYWNSQRVSMCDADASRIRRKDKTQFDENVSSLFGIYDAALECYCKGAHNMKTAKQRVHGKRFVQLKTYCEEHKLDALRSVFDAVVKDLAALVRREVAIKDLPEIYIEALLRMRYFFVVAGTHSADEKLELLIDATQSLFRMLAVYGFIEDIFYSLLEIAENPIADVGRRVGASFWATQILAGFVAFRKCKQMYKADLDENPSTTTKAFDFASLNLENISKKVRKLLIYGGVDLKSTLIFGDSFRRPWVWVFERGFVERRLEAANEYTAPVLKGLLPLVEPALTAAERKTISTLIDTMFELNADVKNGESPKAINDDKIYTVSDLHRDEVAMDFDSGVNDSLSETGTQYGIWTVVPDDEAYNWTICPLGRLPWD